MRASKMEAVAHSVRLFSCRASEILKILLDLSLSLEKLMNVEDIFGMWNQEKLIRAVPALRKHCKLDKQGGLFNW